MCVCVCEYRGECMCVHACVLACVHGSRLCVCACGDVCMYDDLQTCSRRYHSSLSGHTTSWPRAGATLDVDAVDTGCKGAKSKCVSEAGLVPHTGSPGSQRVHARCPEC